MAYQITCDSIPVIAVDMSAGAELQPEVVGCPSGWIITEVQPSDVAQIVALLNFDLSTFSALLGTCIVLFIMGHSAGHVARNLGRA